MKRVVHLATDIDFTNAIVAFRQAVCLPPTGITTTILPWVCWALWSARNMRIFENHTLTAIEVATKALKLAREWINAQNQILKGNGPVPQPKQAKRQQMITGTTATCRSDAAYDKRSRRAGLAWIFKEPSGTHLNQGATTHDLVSFPLMAEALALRNGLLSAVNLELDKLQIFSDNSTLIRVINNDTHVKEIFGILKDIQQISSVFVEITFSHTPRSSNVEVDRLAKHVLSSSLVMDPIMG